MGVRRRTRRGGLARPRDDAPLLAGQLVPFALGILVLGACSVGLDQGGSEQSWRSAVAVLAYPFLGCALLRLVGAYRQVREADILVEASLVGTAVGVVLHAVATTYRTSESFAWGDAASAFPAMLVALDVALLVIAARCMRGPRRQWGPLGRVHIGLVALLLAHLWQEAQVVAGRPAGSVASAFGLIALVALVSATGHPAARTEPDPLLEHDALFSIGHAGIVVVALLATPSLLVVQAVRGGTMSATIAVGAAVSGVLLAAYLVGLLRERARTEHQATHDALTGLPNRTLLVDRLDRSIAHARRNGTGCAVLFIDLDRFKDINDSFGHAAGDHLLTTVAARLVDCARDEDTVARLSGDEFVLLLSHLGGEDDVLVVAQRVLDALGTPVAIADERMLVAGSVGIAVYPNDGATAEELMASADAAMYRAKEAPGSTWEVFSARLATQAQARLHLEAGLLEAIARDELMLHYQPIVDLASGETVGAEALVRWNHPEQGLLLPGEFVPIAERSDLIVMLGEKVLVEACLELRRWQDLGLGGRSISVNVSSRQFNRGLVTTLISVLEATRADPRDLVVELTETAIVDNVEEVAATLAELRALGVRAAIDDFGTGYCGLRYLSALPVSSLKIDRSFIDRMTPSGEAIVSATIAMGKSLGLTLVAEGVETLDQQRFLEGEGCERVQGFLLGRPMSAVDMVQRLRTEAAAPNAGELVTAAGWSRSSRLVR